MTRNNGFLSGSLGYPFPSNVNLQNVLVIAKRQFYVADTEKETTTTKQQQQVEEEMESPLRVDKRFKDEKKRIQLPIYRK